MAVSEMAYSPRPRFFEQGTNLQWFLVISLTYVLSIFISQEFVVSETLMYNSFSEQMAHERILQLIEWQKKTSWLGYAFMPVWVLIRAGGVSLCLTAGGIWWESGVRMKAFWRTALLAEWVFALGGLVLTLVLWGRDVESLGEIQRFHGFSLLAFWPGETGLAAWYILPLKSLNVFHLMYICVLVLLTRPQLKKGWEQTWIFVLSTYGSGWLLGTLIWVFLQLNQSGAL